MKRYRSIGWIIIIVLFFSSCSGFSDVTVGDVQSVSVNGFEDNALAISLSVPVENPTMHRIKISELDAKVYLNGTYLGKVKLSEPFIIEKKTNRSYDLVLKVRVANFLGTAFTMMSMGKGQKVHFRAEGYLLAKSMLLRKKITINEDRDITL